MRAITTLSGTIWFESFRTFLDGVPRSWVLAGIIVFYVIITIWVVTYPSREIYGDDRPPLRRDIRFWAVIGVVIQIALYAVLA